MPTVGPYSSKCSARIPFADPHPQSHGSGVREVRVRVRLSLALWTTIHKPKSKPIIIRSI